MKVSYKPELIGWLLLTHRTAHKIREVLLLRVCNYCSREKKKGGLSVWKAHAMLQSIALRNWNVCRDSHDIKFSWTGHGVGERAKQLGSHLWHQLRCILSSFSTLVEAMKPHLFFLLWRRRWKKKKKAKQSPTASADVSESSWRKIKEAVCFYPTLFSAFPWLNKESSDLPYGCGQASSTTFGLLSSCSNLKAFSEYKYELVPSFMLVKQRCLQGCFPSVSCDRCSSRDTSPRHILFIRYGVATHVILSWNRVVHVCPRAACKQSKRNTVGYANMEYSETWPKNKRKMKRVMGYCIRVSTWQDAF